MVELDRFALKHIHEVLTVSTSVLLDIAKQLRSCHYESDDFVEYINTMDHIFDIIKETYNEDIAIALASEFINKVPGPLKLNDDIIIKSLSARNCEFIKIAGFYKLVDDRGLTPDIPTKYWRLGIIESNDFNAVGLISVNGIGDTTK